MHAPQRPPIPVETLLLAYRSGIFPMADRRDDAEVFWVEPRERAILPLDGLHISKSLRKVLRADRFTGALLWRGARVRGGATFTYAWGVDDRGDRGLRSSGRLRHLHL